MTLDRFRGRWSRRPYGAREAYAPPRRRSSSRRKPGALVGMGPEIPASASTSPGLGRTGADVANHLAGGVVKIWSPARNGNDRVVQLLPGRPRRLPGAWRDRWRVPGHLWPSGPACRSARSAASPSTRRAAADNVVRRQGFRLVDDQDAGNHPSTRPRAPTAESSPKVARPLVNRALPAAARCVDVPAAAELLGDPRPCRPPPWNGG